MTTFRINKNKNYSVINNEFLNDNRLSWKAKGILTWLLSRPDNWQPKLIDMQKRSSDGRDSTSSGINELIKYGYIIRESQRDNKGLFLGYDYQVYELPVSGLTDADIPVSENPVSDNPPLINTDLISTEKTNTKKTNSASNDAQLVLDYFSEINNDPIAKTCKDKTVIAGLKSILKDYNLDDVKLVIDYMANGWYAQNSQNTLSVLTRPTKFYDKLEKARLSAENKKIEFWINQKGKVMMLVDGDWMEIDISIDKILNDDRFKLLEDCRK